MKIDLHTHTTFSDGTVEPDELIHLAAKTGITHLALCDHDSTGGIEMAREKAKQYNISIIPAVEINTRDNVSSVHILGYLVDETNEQFQQTLKNHRDNRSHRVQSILDKLHHMGIKIRLPDFGSRKEGSAIGRPHIADKLKEMGVVFSRQEAFDKYLGQGRPAFVPYENGPTLKDAIDMIVASKGLPVLAHPGYFVSTETIDSLVKMGLQGIEVYYPSHRSDQVRSLLDIAKSRGLVTTGGSDYHGPDSGHEGLGEMAVPEKTVEELFERRKKIYG